MDSLIFLGIVTFLIMIISQNVICTSFFPLFKRMVFGIRLVCMVYKGKGETDCK